MPEVIPYNPLLTYKFRIYFTDDNNPIAGVSKMGALKQKTQNVAWRAGGHMWNSAAQIPGGAEYEPVAFEQGLGWMTGGSNPGPCRSTTGNRANPAACPRPSARTSVSMS